MTWQGLLRKVNEEQGIQMVEPCMVPSGVVLGPIRSRKSVRLNRLPRGSKRRTGVWNGQNVADMVSR